MIEDVVRSLGYGTLGSRLKRIGEKLQSQTQEISNEVTKAELSASLNPVLATLDRNGSLSIGHLAEALGQSQPGVTRMVNKLKAAGLVESQPDEKDRRVNRIALTDRGVALVWHLQQTLWPKVMLAVKDACAGLEGSLLQQLSQLEDALNEQPLRKRCSSDSLPDWSRLAQEMEDPR